MCGEFFRTHGQRSTGEQIRSLKAHDGSIKIGPEVMDMATDYPSMRDALLAPFIIIEMQDTVRDIDGKKCPGEDRLSRAF